MIIYSDFSIFDIEADIIVNTINCRGVMGAGIALEISLRYPDLFDWYKRECNLGKIRIGECYLYENQNAKIMNLPTKDDPYQPSKVEYISNALSWFAKNYQHYNFESIAFPYLGSTSGKLNFEEVKPLMEKYLSRIDKTIYICSGREQGNGIDKKMLEQLKGMKREDLSEIIDKDENDIVPIYNQIQNLTFFHELRDLKLVDLKTYQRLYKKFYCDLKTLEG